MPRFAPLSAVLNRVRGRARDKTPEGDNATPSALAKTYFQEEVLRNMASVAKGGKYSSTDAGKEPLASMWVEFPDPLLPGRQRDYEWTEDDWRFSRKRLFVWHLLDMAAAKGVKLPCFANNCCGTLGSAGWVYPLREGVCADGTLFYAARPKLECNKCGEWVVDLDWVA